ncbi:PrsW family intramembrane metalloprotease [candidate division WOR-3 bacterium]|nr:PrsW family intramembrane metalloprotease [candidate division WOR-3 bacterium]
MLLTLLALAIAPGLALGLFFYLRDRFRKEPLWQLVITFLLGAVILIPAAITSVILQRLTGWTSDETGILRLFLGALLVVGLVEEGWKFLVVRVYSYAQPDFDEPYDGIVYAVAASLGFATVENILYVTGGGIGVGILRALLAVPGHAFYAVLMGFFLGEAKFARTRTRAALYQAAGLGLAVVAHGLYDFMVFSAGQHPLMLLMLPVFGALTWAVFFTATRVQAEKSFRRRPDLVRLAAGDSGGTGDEDRPDAG